MRRDGIKRGIASNQTIHHCPSCCDHRNINMASVYQELRELKNKVTNCSRCHILNMNNFKYLHFSCEEEKESLIQHLIKVTTFDIGFLSATTSFQRRYHRCSHKGDYDKRSPTVYQRKAKYICKDMTHNDFLFHM